MDKRIEIIRKYHPQCNLDDDEIIEEYSALGTPQMMQEYAEWLAEQAFIEGASRMCGSLSENTQTRLRDQFSEWFEKFKKQQE